MSRIIPAVTALLCVSGLVFAEDKEPEKLKHPIYGQKIKSLTGKTIDLKEFRGKVLLIVNTASECGATPQYDTLQALHEALEDKGLAVMGFPCNQFGAQEPGSNKEIATFCRKNYGVDFTMFGKVDVNGEKAAPLFKYLTGDKSGLKKAGPVQWNFEKFLVSRKGEVVARFDTGVEPDSDELLDALVTELKKDAPKKKASSKETPKKDTPKTK